MFYVGRNEMKTPGGSLPSELRACCCFAARCLLGTDEAQLPLTTGLSLFPRPAPDPGTHRDNSRTPSLLTSRSPPPPPPHPSPPGPPLHSIQFSIDVFVMRGEEGIKPSKYITEQAGWSKSGIF